MHNFWFLEGQKYILEQLQPSQTFLGADPMVPWKLTREGSANDWRVDENDPRSGQCPTVGWLFSWLIGWSATIGLLILGQNGLGPQKLPPAGGHHRGDCQQGGVVVFVGHDRHRQCHHQHHDYQYHYYSTLQPPQEKNTQKISAGSYVLQFFPSFRWVWMVEVEIGCFLCKLFWLFGNQKGRRVAGNCSSLVQLIWAQNEGVMVTRINWTNVLSLPDQPSYQNKGFWQI